jgi:ubiquinone/menaquinone biosynthesis C-methylase UbiE
VDHSDHVALIRDGVTGTGSRWADVGAGRGAFTLALAELLGPGAEITAVDRDQDALRDLEQMVQARYPATRLTTLTADFTRPLSLTGVDGVVMANSLHFVRDKTPVVALMRDLLRPDGRFVLVEYDADRGNAWVPYPLSYPQWERIAAAAGFRDTRLIGRVPSGFLNAIYAAVSVRPESSARVLRPRPPGGRG